LFDDCESLVPKVIPIPQFAGYTGLVTGGGFPAVNVWEDGENVFVEAEVPGLKAEGLDITVVGDELTLKGERSEESEEQASFHRRERGIGPFTRVIRLSSEVKADQVQASLTDGILLLKLPKTEAAKPRKIKVKTASGEGV